MDGVFCANDEEKRRRDSPFSAEPPSERHLGKAPLTRRILRPPPPNQFERLDFMCATRRMDREHGRPIEDKRDLVVFVR